jgi:mRNA interferase RelE/StbE
MSYEIQFTKSAQKELAKLPKGMTVRIVRALFALQNDPRKGNVRPMVGTKAWRLRVGDYRVVYDIHDEILVILVIKIAHRKDVYR